MRPAERKHRRQTQDCGYTNCCYDEAAFACNLHITLANKATSNREHVDSNVANGTEKEFLIVHMSFLKLP